MFQKARESTKQYHTNLYKTTTLFKKGSWLEKPEKDIIDAGKKLLSKHNIRILDLGSGIGRNTIPLAQMLIKNNPHIICIDYLDIAIEKLKKYAKQYKVIKFFETIVFPVEEYPIKKERFDLIISHGVLDHVKDKQTLLRILKDIANGVKKGGYVYLSISSDLQETETKTNKKLDPIVEIYLKSSELIRIYKSIFKGWRFEILRLDPYVEYYERDGQKIEWKCDFVTLVGHKQ